MEKNNFKILAHAAGILLAAAGLILPLAALASLNVQFDNGGNATTTPGSRAVINGAISADAWTYLNFPGNLSVTGNGQGSPGGSTFPTINASTTATYLPASVSTSTPYSGPLVAVDVPASTVLGNYYGFYGIIGGDTASSTNVLTSQPFYLHVVASSGTGSIQNPIASSTANGLQMPTGLAFNDSQTQNGLAFSQPSFIYPAGPRLIKLDGDGTVYWVSPNNLKIPMTSAKVFLSYNNKWSDVQTVSTDEFNYYPNARFIWLNGQGAIYMIDTGLKQYVPSNLWNNSGIDPAQIINVNKTDFNSYKNGAAVNDPGELAGPPQLQ